MECIILYLSKICTFYYVNYTPAPTSSIIYIQTGTAKGKVTDLDTYSSQPNRE